MNSSIAFFDFDGTITKKDTFLAFIRYAKGNLAFVTGFIICSPFILAYKLKLITNQKAKEKVLSYYFRNNSLTEFDNICKKFATDQLPLIIRKNALIEIQKLQNQNFKITVVSASPVNWVAPWAEQLKLEYICTRLEISDGKLTGRILGNNCFGEEKVSRIKEKYELGNYTEIYAYGDSPGDYAMLKLAHKSHFKPFR